jgi:hypothetical protein
MTALLNVIREISAQSSGTNAETVSLLAKDINYIDRSSSIVREALSKGSDILQLANGDLVITEVKTVSYKYVWDNEKGRFCRANSGNRAKRPRKNKKAAAV